MSQDQLDILKRKLQTEKQARKTLEKRLEEKTKKFKETSKKLKEANKELENLFEEKTLELNGVFENIVDAHVVMDMDGVVIKFNDAATKLFGYDLTKEFLNVKTLIHKDDYKYAIASFSELETKGFFKDYEARICTKNKEIKWVHINASVIYNKFKVPIAAQGIVRDITKEREAEEQLIESENRLSTLILNLDSGVLLEDENRKIVLTNTKFCDLFSIPVAPENLIGTDCSSSAEQSKGLFQNPEEFVIRINDIVKRQELVLGDELKMTNGKILERDYIPIFKNSDYKGHLWSYRDITLKRNYRQSIEAQREKYSSIIANMNLGLVEVNNDDEILMINQSFAEMSGYSEEEILGKKGGGVFQADPESDIIEIENKKRQKGESNSYELRAKKKSGEIRHWLISGAPNYDVNGNLTGSIGIHLDITDNKQNTALIQEQKRELDVIFNNSPIGIVLTESGNIRRTNKSFQDLLGFSEDELNELTIKALSFNEDYPESKIYLDKMNSGEIDNFTIVKRYKKKDGSVIWAKTKASIVRDNDGSIKYQVALVEDITSEREKTLIIDMINNLTKSILGKTDINEIAWEIVNNIAEYLDSQDCVIYLVDRDNQTLEQIAVYGEEFDKDNRKHNRFKLPIGKGIVGDVARTAISEVVKDTSKDSRYIVDGERRFSEITVPIISNGRVIGVIDSEHKDKNYYTNENVKVIEGIASLVALKLRTTININEREKTEAKNVHLLSELEKSNNELQEYAHIVSHDLKSPLRSIYALVSWLKEDNNGKLDDTSLQNFTHIEEILEKMDLLISDILDYSSAGVDNTKKVNVNIDTLVKDSIKMLYIPEHITVLVENKLPSIKGDKTKLQQLFQNLIGNAIKFIDKPQGEIKINVKSLKNYYEFSISDNGMGIDKKYHDTIFKVFHSLNKSKESTGIGLSIVKKIVDLHEGKIWLESEINVGTTFYFTIKK